MASKEKATALEKELTQRFEELPLHIRIVYRQPPEGGGWYDWYTSTDGGESGTFADAVIQSVTCVQEKQGGILEAHREAHAKAERATLGTCLQRVKKARPTAVLFLHMGNAGWMTRQEALESVRLDRYLPGARCLPH